MELYNANSEPTEGAGGDVRSAFVREAEGVDTNSNSSNPSLDHTKLHIFDLNAYCLSEIMRNLAPDDLLELEQTNTYFGEYLPFFYRRNLWKFGRFKKAHYPDWLWRKMGHHVENVLIPGFIRTGKTLNRFFRHFPNIQKLTCWELELFMVPNLPKQLRSLRLHKCRLPRQCGVWFRKISATLTEIEVMGPTRIGVLKHMRHIKRAAFCYTKLNCSELESFLQNNRNSLETLSLEYSTKVNLTDKCFRNMEMLSNLASIQILDDLNLNRLSASFRAQIKCLGIFTVSSEVLLTFTQLECLRLIEYDCDVLLELIINMSTLKSITFQNSKEETLAAFLRKLKPILQSRKRKMTIFVQQNWVS